MKWFSSWLSLISLLAVITWAPGCDSAEEPEVLIEDLELGDGTVTAQVGDSLYVDYQGWLLAGARFDSGSVSFKLGTGEMIAGWEQGLVGIKVNGKRKLTIPPELGYGNAPVVNREGEVVIPANSTLIFEVVLRRLTQGPLSSARN